MEIACARSSLDLFMVRKANRPDGMVSLCLSFMLFCTLYLTLPIHQTTRDLARMTKLVFSSIQVMCSHFFWEVTISLLELLIALKATRPAKKEPPYAKVEQAKMEKEAHGTQEEVLAPLAWKKLLFSKKVKVAHGETDQESLDARKDEKNQTDDEESNNTKAFAEAPDANKTQAEDPENVEHLDVEVAADEKPVEEDVKECEDEDKTQFSREVFQQCVGEHVSETLTGTRVSGDVQNLSMSELVLSSAWVVERRTNDADGNLRRVF